MTTQSDALEAGQIAFAALETMLPPPSAAEVAGEFVADFSIENPVVVVAAIAVGAVAIGYGIYKAGEAAAPVVLETLGAIALSAAFYYDDATTAIGRWFSSEPTPSVT